MEPEKPIPYVRMWVGKISSFPVPDQHSFLGDPCCITETTHRSSTHRLCSRCTSRN